MFLNLFQNASFAPGFWLFRQTSPLQLGLLVLLLDFGVINVIRFFGGRLSHMFYYVAGGPLGDGILLPLLTFGLAVVIQSLPIPAEGFYTKTWWHVLILLLAPIFPILQQYTSYKAGGARWTFAGLPEQWWHMTIFIVLLYVFLSLLPVLFVSQTPIWAFLLTVVCFLAFIACVVWDGFHDPVV